MREPELLYKRSKKHRDLMDKIHESIQNESYYEKENDFAAAASAGLCTWVYLKKLMAVLDATHMCDLEYETGYDLPYWASILADNLHNASLKDNSFLQKKFLFSKEYVEMHQDLLSNEMRNLGSIRRSLADCYIDEGDCKTCDSLYEAWLQKEPDWGWGWIGWSDSYWLFTGKNKKNLEKALFILEQGLAIKNVNNKEDMVDRFNSLKKEIPIQS